MKKCVRCGKEFADELTTCPSDGYALEPSGGSKTLPVNTPPAHYGEVNQTQSAPPIVSGLGNSSNSNIPLDRLRDPKEMQALMWLHVASVPAFILFAVWTISSLGIPLILTGFLFLVTAFGELFFSAYLRTNAIRASEHQLPELFHAAQEGARKLGMECPEIYVLQHNVWNAFATRIFGRRMVVLFSGAVDSILLKGDVEQLSWVIGHELGHHWAGHFTFKQKLARWGGWLVWVNLWHSRRRELTCDRVGLYCSGSLKSARLAMLNLTAGAQLAAKANPDAAIAQWQQHRGEFFVKYRTLYSSYPHLLARLENLELSAREFGMS